MKAVRVSLSVACLSCGVAWASALPLLFHIVPLVPYRDVAVVIFGVGHLIAILAVVVAAVEGISAFVRHREDCGFVDISLTAVALILCALVAYWFVTPHYVY